MKSKETKRTEAALREAASAALTIEQKLAKLPANGAKRQRARYLAKLEARKIVKQEQSNNTEKKTTKKKSANTKA